MMINEKQIMQLIFFANAYRNELLIAKLRNLFTDTEQNLLDHIGKILTDIINHQSEKLIELKDE